MIKETAPTIDDLRNKLLAQQYGAFFDASPELLYWLDDLLDYLEFGKQKENKC